MTLETGLIKKKMTPEAVDARLILQLFFALYHRGTEGKTLSNKTQ